MTKLLTIVKREYMERVRARMFILTTVLGPVMLAVFAVVPALMFQIKAGGATRIAVVDETGRMFDRVREAIMRPQENEDDDEAQDKFARSVKAGPQERMQQTGSASAALYEVSQAQLDKPLSELEAELEERIRHRELDGYIVIPPDVLERGEVQYYTRNVGDVFTKEQLAHNLSSAIIEQRMADAKIDQEQLQRMSRPVDLKTFKSGERGKEQDSGQGFFVGFIVAFLIYLTLTMYGQVTLAAVVQEKETRLSEVLFSSVRAFPLMMGKLLGVSLVALTQLGIWTLAFALFALFGVAELASRGMTVPLPHISLAFYIYFFLFFLLGYFVYCTIYALVGSMVTTSQEGGQLSFPVILLLMAGFYLSFPILRSPDSSLAFWVSMVPFFSPIVMPVRIVSLTPPFWQIALSLAVGAVTVVGLIWLAARIYRIGMLMYGKRASIPEVIRWVRQP